MKRPIFVDTDLAFDDGLALLALCCCKDIQIVGISLCEDVGGDFPEILAHPKLQGVPIYHTSSSIAPEDAIFLEAKKYKGRLVLLCLAPLGNVARALLQHPELPFLFSEVVVMGGGISIGNITPFSEFNFYKDAPSAKAVLHSGTDFTLFPIDMGEHIYFSESEINALSDSKIAREAVSLFSQLHARYSQTSGRHTAYDLGAAIYLTNPDIFETKLIGVEICTEGEYQGALTVGNGTEVKIVTGCSRPEFVKTVSKIFGGLEFEEEQCE